MKKLICLIGLIFCLSAITVRADTIGDYSFTIPENLKQEKSTEDSSSYFNDSKTVYLSITKTESSVTDDKTWEIYKKEFVNTLGENSYPLKLSLSLEDGNVCGMPASFKAMIGQTEDSQTYFINTCIFCDFENKNAYLIYLAAGLTEDGKSDPVGIVKSVADSTTPINQELSSDPIDSDGVTPEFKEQMDSLLEFFKECYDFMKKYTNGDSTDILGMLDEYTDMVNKYAEAMDTLDSIDQDSLSPADEKYYLNTLLEVEKLTINMIN